MTTGRAPLLAIALVSACALAYEVLLVRLFSLIQWHHFAYMMISVALLGYGAAGALLSLAVHRPHDTGRALAWAAGAFGVTSLVSFMAVQRIEFNPLELLWDRNQPLKLVLVYLLLFVPFVCAGFCISLTLSRFPAEIPRIYSFDVRGAATGAVLIVLALFVVPPLGALQLISSTALVAAGVACISMGSRRRAAFIWFAAALLPFALPQSLTALSPSPYKELSQALLVPDARVLAERSSPLAVLTVVESPRIPFRHAPGMSLNSPAEPPQQLALFSDGDAPSMITRYDGQREPLAYLDFLTSAAPYHLLSRPQVLVLGAGAGTDVLAALYHGARAIDAVELNAQAIRLVDVDFAAFSGRPYSADGVRVFVAEARSFVAGDRGRYDLIDIALVDAFGTAAAGLHALSESYLYTVEGLRDYLSHLEPGGLLSITRWVTLPPRDALKLFATAAVALEANGVAAPHQQLALIRGLKTATLLVKNGAFTATDIARLRAFCRERSFDVAYYPGIPAGEDNRYTVLDQPYFAEAVSALLSPTRDAFIARYKFDIAPATDDKPYFFNFFRWSTLPELWQLKDQGGIALVDWGYPVLVATLAQATLVSVVAVVAPVLARMQRRRTTSALSRIRVGGYFFAIGVAFMLIEIAFIQKLVLFLGHPLYAVPVVLAGFLAFAGFGAHHAQRILPRRRAERVAQAALAIVGIGTAYLVLLPFVLPPLMPLPDPLKIAFSLLLIAPLAFAMGLPFPCGLAATADVAGDLVPWAWAVNGCASVIGAVAAALLAVELGFTTVIVMALALYALAAASAP